MVPFQVHWGVRTPRWDPARHLCTAKRRGRIRPPRCWRAAGRPAPRPDAAHAPARPGPEVSTTVHGGARVTSVSTPARPPDGARMSSSTPPRPRQRSRASPAPRTARRRPRRRPQPSPRAMTTRRRRRPTPAARVPSALRPASARRRWLPAASAAARRRCLAPAPASARRRWLRAAAARGWWLLRPRRRRRWLLTAPAACYPRPAPAAGGYLPPPAAAGHGRLPASSAAVRGWYSPLPPAPTTRGRRALPAVPTAAPPRNNRALISSVTGIASIVFAFCCSPIGRSSVWSAPCSATSREPRSAARVSARRARTWPSAASSRARSASSCRSSPSVSVRRTSSAARRLQGDQPDGHISAAGASAPRRGVRRGRVGRVRRWAGLPRHP